MKFKGNTLFLFLLISVVNAGIAENSKAYDSKLISINKEESFCESRNNTLEPYGSLPSEELINTMYPDPLAEGFIKQDSALEKDRNRTVGDMLDEFNSQAKVINDSTVVPDDIKDNHSVEDRKRIESKADMLLLEKELINSAENRGEKYIEDTLATESIVEIASSSIEEYKNEAKIEDFPEQVDDPEFASPSYTLEEPRVSNDDVEIPDYTSMTGVTKIVSGEAEGAVSDSNKEKPGEKSVKVSKRELLRRKMSKPLEPVLLQYGKPKDEGSEANKEFSFTGLLIPENHAVTSRKKMIRWVLQMEDGQRIPLKSNLKLLQEVRNTEKIEDYVTVKGKLRTSALENNLKYLVAEEITKGKLPAKKSSDSKPVDMKDDESVASKVATETAEIEEKQKVEESNTSVNE